MSYLSEMYRNISENFNTFAENMVAAILQLENAHDSESKKSKALIVSTNEVEQVAAKLSKAGFKNIRSMLNTIRTEHPDKDKSIKFMSSLINSGYRDEDGTLHEFSPEDVTARFRAFCIAVLMLEKKEKLPLPSWKDGTLSWAKLSE